MKRFVTFFVIIVLLLSATVLFSTQMAGEGARNGENPITKFKGGVSEKLITYNTPRSDTSAKIEIPSDCRITSASLDAEGILKRYNMRCISCKSCAVACPFGTIYTEALPFFASSCDYCIDRLSPGEAPLCVRTSPDEAIQYTDVEADESKEMYKVGDHLVVKCKAWKR